MKRSSAEMSSSGGKQGQCRCNQYGQSLSPPLHHRSRLKHATHHHETASKLRKAKKGGKEAVVSLRDACPHDFTVVISAILGWAVGIRCRDHQRRSWGGQRESGAGTTRGDLVAVRMCALQRHGRHMGAAVCRIRVI
jgi:hypothetical protein